MAATKVGIVYSVAQRRRRVLVVPDDDAKLVAVQAGLRQGEAYVEQTLDDFQQFGADHAVAVAAGGSPLSDRCAVIGADGTVVKHVKADPAIDETAAGSLIQSDRSAVGDVYADGVFTRRYALVRTSDSVVVSVVSADIENPPTAPAGQIVWEPAGNLEVAEIAPVDIEVM